MATFTEGKDLLARQKQRLQQAQAAQQKAHTQAVKDTADYARSLLQGKPIQRTPAQRRTPFQRLPRAFPIGYRSGALARSLRIVSQSNGSKTTAFLTFDSPAAPFVLSPQGTRRMAGTPFWSYVNQFYVARAHDLHNQARQRVGRS